MIESTKQGPKWHERPLPDIVKYLTLVQVDGIHEGVDNSGYRKLEISEAFWTCTDGTVTQKIIEAYLSQGYTIYEPYKDSTGVYAGSILLLNERIEQNSEPPQKLPHPWDSNNDSGPRLWRPGAFSPQ